MPFVVRRVDWAGPDGEKVRQVRHDVFIVEQQIPAEEEWDATDATALHVLAEDASGEPVGTGRLHQVEPGMGKLCRIAVLKDYRQQGAGLAIVEALLTEARRLGLQRAKLHAQTHAVGVYRRAGFEVYGEEFLECDLPHLAMKREL